MAFERISETIVPLIKLVLRSPDQGDGWRKVSETLRHTIAHWVAEEPDLFEVDETDGLKVRLSEEGRVIAKYA